MFGFLFRVPFSAAFLLLAWICFTVPLDQSFAQGIDFEKAKPFGVLNIKMDGKSIEFEMTGFANATTTFHFSMGPESQGKRILEKYQSKNSDPLKKILADINKNERRQANALAALGSMGKEALPYVDLILPLLDNQDKSLGFNAFWALAQIAPDDPVVVDRLVEYYRSHVDLYPAVGLSVIAPFREDLSGLSVSILEAVIENGEASLPVGQILLQDKTQGLEPTFIKYLQHSDEEVRKNAATMAAALVKLDKKPLVPYLLPLLEDEDRNTRTIAAYTLGLSYQLAEQAIPILKEMGNSMDEVERQTALSALVNMGYYEPGTAGEPSSTNITHAQIIQDLDSGIEEKIILAVRAVKEMRNEERIALLPVIAEKLPTAKTNISRAIMSLLIDMKEDAPPAIPKLLELFSVARKKGQFKQQKDVLATLSHIAAGQHQLVPFILELFEENDPRLVPGAIALMYVVGPEKVPATHFIKTFLEEALEDWKEYTYRGEEDEFVLLTALRIIQTLKEKDEEIKALLEEYSQVKNRNVSFMASRVLEELS